jgi:hypothetical protein
MQHEQFQAFSILAVVSLMKLVITKEKLSETTVESDRRNTSNF